MIDAGSLWRRGSSGRAVTMLMGEGWGWERRSGGGGGGGGRQTKKTSAKENDALSLSLSLALSLSLSLSLLRALVFLGPRKQATVLCMVKFSFLSMFIFLSTPLPSVHSAAFSMNICF